MSGHDHHGSCHSHSHGDDHHDHDHSNDVTPALQSNLYSQIDFDKIVTLNEADASSGIGIVKKTWAQRLDAEPELRSDADEQLIMNIPFISQIKLHSLLIYTSPTPSAPKTLKLFRNRQDLDFTTATDLSPTQKLEVPQTLTGSDSDVIELPLNRAHWNMTTSISLFFEDNWSGGDEEETTVSYIGFKGEFMRLNREPVSFLYEAAANPKDHVAIAGVDGVGKVLPRQG